MKILSYLALNPTTGLEKQPLFWLAITIPVMIALGVAIPVWLDYSISFNEEAYSKFLSISRLPIGIISLAIPLGVLIGKLHGARQTAMQIDHAKKQIENTEKQISNTEKDNKTKFYLSHFDHFCKHVDFVEGALANKYEGILDDNPLPIINKLSLYRKIYPENSLEKGVASASTHFDTFSKNTAARLHRSYKNFVHLSLTEQSLEENLCNIENNLLDFQIRCLACLNSRSSIFKKIHPNNDSQIKNLVFGFNKNIDNYTDQVIFFLELIDGVDSFYAQNSSEKIAEHFLNDLRMPHTSKLSEISPLHDLWEIFIATHIPNEEEEQLMK